MAGRFKVIQKQSIKQRSEDIPLNPESESYIRNKIIEPTKTDYAAYEFGELNYRDAGLTDIPKEDFKGISKEVISVQKEASHWVSMGGPYAGLAELCNVENKFRLRLYSSREGWLGNNLLAPPQKATIRQYKKEEGKQGTVSRLVSPQRQDEYGGIE